MNRRGTILIVTMVVSLALAATVLVLCRSMRVETSASANILASAQASAVERGAEQYVIALITQQRDALRTMSEDQFDGVPVGDGFFWILRPTYNDSSQPAFGLVEEAAKLNINYTSFDSLMCLPGMTYTAGSCIMDWRDEDTRLERDGAENDYYLSLPDPYYCKDNQFETVEELLLVRGVDRLMLYGDGSAAPLGTRAGITVGGMSATDPDIARGLSDYVTVYSAEPNVNASGARRLNLSVDREDRPKMREQLYNKLKTILDQGRAKQIADAVGNDRVRDLITDFYFRCKLTPEEFDQVADELTTTGDNTIRGRIDINTAPRQVLATLGGGKLDSGDVETMISQRPTDGQGIGWFVRALGEKSRGLGSSITTRSYQWTADILAVSGNGRAFKHVRIVADIRRGTPRILYRRDLTPQGWPMDPAILSAIRAGQWSSPRSSTGRLG